MRFTGSRATGCLEDLKTYGRLTHRYMYCMEIRDLDEARRYVLQGLWLTRVVAPASADVAPALEWANTILGQGDPLPSIGLIADLGRLAFGPDARAGKEFPILPKWPANLPRLYEDYVLGKFHGDPYFERAVDALRRYDASDRPRGLAFVVRQFRERAGIGGAEFSPAVIRSLMKSQANDLLGQGYESFSRFGSHPLLVKQYEDLITASRKISEVLGPEDVIALEQRTALADMSRFVAHRQILTLTAQLESRLPARPIRPLIGRREVPTRVLDEDQYPVGGYTSLSNRGSIESLLHSQLAYMEPAESPDLFDVKFARDELFYYSRDENQFLRRRRSFIFVLSPDLIAARFKDEELPCQRIVMVSAVVLALVRKLTSWLSTDALHIELHFIRDGKAEPLALEAELFTILLRELIENQSAIVVHSPAGPAVAAHCERLSRQSQVQVLELATNPSLAEPTDTVLTTLRVDGPQPQLTDGFAQQIDLGVDDALEGWIAAVRTVLELWI